MGKFSKPPRTGALPVKDEEAAPPLDTALRPGDVGGKGKAVKPDREQQAVIDRHLQALYNEVISQPLPDKIKALLGNMDEAPVKDEPGDA